MTQDLFKSWVIIIQWGRWGRNGQYKEYVFEEESVAKKEFERILNKRLNAKNRIGCNYVILEPKRKKAA